MVAEQNICFVPWADISEWNTVKDQIFSSNIKDTIRAFETILMWKLKYDKIPAYVECTFSLLQVMVKEYEMTRNDNPTFLNEYDLQLSYSTALIRFVNHVTSVNAYKGETLYWAAKTRNIPDWIINMRHDAAHGQDLPSLEALHVAAEISLKWLLNNYWGKNENFKEKNIEVLEFDLDSGLNLEEDTNVGNFFKKALSIWEISSNVKKIEKLKNMSQDFYLNLEEMLNVYNDYLKNSVYYNATELENIVKDFSRLQECGQKSSIMEMKIKDFKELLLKFLKTVMKSKPGIKPYFLMSLLESTFLTEKPITKKWKSIICLIQEVRMLSSFLHILFQLTAKGNQKASEWLMILYPPIKQLKKQWALFKLLKKEKKLQVKILKGKVKKSCKVKQGGLAFELGIFKPPVITLDMMNGVLMNPETLPIKGIFEYLKLVKPPLQSLAINMIKQLIEVQTVKETPETMEEPENDKIYTVEDLMDIAEKEPVAVREEAKGDGWVKSSIGIEVWNKCPLGLLPFQSGVNCNLPENITWKRQAFPGKHSTIPLVNHSVNMERMKETVK